MNANKLGTCSILVAAAAWCSVPQGCRRNAPAAGGHDEKAHPEGDGHDHGAEEAAHADEVSLTRDAIERYGVRTETAQLWALRPTFTAPARIGFNLEAMAHVGSPLRGRITEIKVKLGELVAAGQPLFLVESPELGEAQAEFLQRRIARDSAAPAVELSRSSWERAQTLLTESQGIAMAEVQRRELEHKAAVAAFRAADSSVTSAMNRLRLLGMSREEVDTLATSLEVTPHHAILAPIAGTVVQREVTKGELVGPDRESLAIIADTSRSWVLADVPEAVLPDIHVGATCWIELGLGEGSAHERLEAKIDFLSPFLDPATRTAEARIEVAGGGGALRPGMFARVEIVAGDPAAPDPVATVAVPDEALQTIEGATAIFVPVADEPDTFRARMVRVGPAIGRLVPILAGLVEGEAFVVSGTFILKAELGKGSAAHQH